MKAAWLAALLVAGVALAPRAAAQEGPPPGRALAEEGGGSRAGALASGLAGRRLPPRGKLVMLRGYEAR